MKLVSVYKVKGNFMYNKYELNIKIFTSIFKSLTFMMFFFKLF